MPLMGMPVIESLYAEKRGEPRIVRRTWRERWLSWPWHPWVKTRTEIPMVPAIYQFADKLVVHPSLMPELRKLVDHATPLATPPAAEAEGK